MSDQSNTCPQWLRSFASLNWYEETIKFIFNFVTRTSELLLAAGIVISTANFLTDGDVMGHNRSLSDAWSWAQALAIDSSLGIVFLNAFQAVREREKVKAVIFFTLTALLASVAGLITHFDAYSHASGLPITDKSVSGFIPLWIMTALRSVAVIGFLLASRLKNVSFNELHRQPAQNPHLDPAHRQKLPLELGVPEVDYNALATALIEAMRQAGTIGRISITEEGKLDALPQSEQEDHHYLSKQKLLRGTVEQREPTSNGNQRRKRNLQVGTRANYRREPEASHGNRLAERRKPGQSQEQEPVHNENPSTGTETHPQWEPTSTDQEVGTDDSPGQGRIAINIGIADERLKNAYQAMKGEGDQITGKALSKRAGVRKQTALEWLQKLQEHGAEQEERAEQE